MRILLQEGSYIDNFLRIGRADPIIEYHSLSAKKSQPRFENDGYFNDHA